MRKNSLFLQVHQTWEKRTIDLITAIDAQILATAGRGDNQLTVYNLSCPEIIYAFEYYKEHEPEFKVAGFGNTLDISWEWRWDLF